MRIAVSPKASLVSLAVVLCAVSLVVLVGSCGSDNPVTSTTSGTLKVRQVVSLPTTVTWRKVWGLDASHVYAMGDDGRSFRGNGATWTALPSTKAPDRLLLSAWGDRPDNIYFVGTIQNYDTVTVTEIEDDDTTTTTTIYDVPWLTNYNGVAFENVLTDMEHGGLNDIWGTSPDNIYAVGDFGTIIHYDGATWSTVFNGGDTPVQLLSVWGTGPDNVFVCGTSGTVLHFDGAQWKVMRAGIGASLWQAWGPSANSVYIVGSNGYILHYDGTSISRMTSPVTSSIYSVWGTADNNVYAVGYGGILLHYDGTSWSELDTITAYNLYSVWGSDANDFYAVGQTVLHGAGDIAVSRVAGAANLNDVWVSSSGTASPLRVAVGDSGLTMTSGTGTSWTVIPSNTSRNLNGTWGDPASNLRFAVGDNGTILSFTAGDDAWEDISPSGVTYNLNAVSGINDSTVWAVGDNGTLLQLNYDDMTWVPVATGITANLNDIGAGVSGSDTLAFAVGDNGWTLYYNGSYWDAGQAPTTENLHSVSNDGIAVGDNGTVLVWADGDWHEFAYGRTENLRAIWTSSDAQVLYVVAEDGGFFTYGGGTWTQIDGVAKVNFNGIYGYGTENINIVGDYDHLMLYSR